MRKIRLGTDVRRTTMLRILRAARDLTGREVELNELFDLDVARD